MDTGSAYMALSGSPHSVIKPERRLTFYEPYDEWFPRPYCTEHKASFIASKMAEYDGCDLWTLADCCIAVEKYDIRTPGLFKNEFEGDVAISTQL